MKIRCKYCDNYISDTDETCSHCGAVNSDLVRVGDGVPKTIDELKDWYVKHNLPDENITRFFIGKDIKEARAFGIYYDSFTKNYIVYKNKDDGSRAIRYEGKDEEYAVNELYLKLKSEILNQKSHQNFKKNGYIPSGLFFVHFIAVFVFWFSLIYSPIAYLFLFFSINPGCFIMIPILNIIKNEKTRKLVDKLWHILSLIIFLIILVTTISLNKYEHKNDAYYYNSAGYYYLYGDEWYHYENNAWYTYDGDTSDFKNVGSDYNSTYGISDFKTSNYYEDYDWSSSSSSSDWDSDSSWSSSDSWDSGGTDWSSDW